MGQAPRSLHTEAFISGLRGAEHVCCAAKPRAGPRTPVGEGGPEAPLMEFSPAELQGEVHVSRWHTALCARGDHLKDCLLEQNPAGSSQALLASLPGMHSLSLPFSVWH